MTDLGLFLGAAMASAAHARRMADEEALAIAEYYAETPGLAGMTVPRMRMPEITLELPVLVEEVDAGGDERPASPSKVRESVLASIHDFAKRERVPLSDEMIKAIDKEVTRDLESPKLLGGDGSQRTGLRTKVGAAVEKAVAKSLKDQDRDEVFKAGQKKAFLTHVSKDAALAAVADAGRPPKIKTTVITDAVKNQAGAQNVARVRVVLREEGLEWTSHEDADGVERPRLTPE